MITVTDRKPGLRSSRQSEHGARTRDTGTDLVQAVAVIFWQRCRNNDLLLKKKTKTTYTMFVKKVRVHKNRSCIPPISYEQQTIVLHLMVGIVIQQILIKFYVCDNIQYSIIYVNVHLFLNMPCYLFLFFYWLIDFCVTREIATKYQIHRSFISI